MRAVLAIILLSAAVAGFSPLLQFGATHTSSPPPARHNGQLAMARGPKRGRWTPPPKEAKPPMNEEITAQELRVVTPSPGGKDEALGIMSREEAMQKAKDLGGLDLIMVNDKSDPPVCKIVDYSKYRYMQEKKAKEIKKNSKANEVKEVKMSYKIDVHDYDVRKKNAVKFIKQGNRVKATIMFRGREVQHDKLGYELLDKLAADMEDICVREGKAKREGRNLSLILGPRAEVLKAVNEGRKMQDKAKKQKKKEAFDDRNASKSPTTSETINGNAPHALDDDDDVNDISLDELLGSEELVDDLFSKQ